MARYLITQDRGLLLQIINSLPKKYKLIIALVLGSNIAGVAYLIKKYLSGSGKEETRGRELFRQTSSILLSDGWSREIYVPSKGKLSRVVIKPTKRVTFEAHRRLFLGIDSEGTAKTGVNSLFMKQFSAIWSIVVPRLRSKSTALLLVHAVFLAARTYLSLLVAKLDGRIVRDLIAGNGKEFLRGLAYWFVLAVPASYTNAMIKFLQAKISIEFRTRLIRYIHDIYLSSNLGYYKLNNIDGAIQGADQYITADITRFCDAAASLYSNLGKPSADFLIFSYQLSRNLGPLALFGIFSNYALTAWILKKVAPPFGKLAAVEAKLEGDYRNAHSKLITNAEEIAFYDGTGLERSILTKTYRRLIAHTTNILKIKVSYNMFEDFTLKYAWSALGYLFTSLPVFLPTWSGAGGISELAILPSAAQKDLRERDRMKEFITNKRLMLSLADAGGRMMYSIKDLAELAGYTSRVFQLLSSLHRVHANAYGKEYITGKERLLMENDYDEYESGYRLSNVRGTVQKGFIGVRFENTPIVVPGLGRDDSPGEVLIDELNVLINPGEHLLISGANGVGKSSIARVLAGLWPVFDGLVSKPVDKDIAFLPQRPYFTGGSLRDQIIYPYSHAEMLSMGKTDKDLMEILDKVKLEYIPSREGGWNTRKEWKDVLSGGEKQRVMFARILFKNPKFAVIDEGTSAVSSDVEGVLYETCKKANITLITISHRPSLLKYHSAQLRIMPHSEEDEPQWILERTDSKEAKLSVEKEIEYLKSQLSRVDEWKVRRKEIGELLAKGTIIKTN